MVPRVAPNEMGVPSGAPSKAVVVDVPPEADR